MKKKITISLTISNDFEIDIKEDTPKNVFDAFMEQHGLPVGVSMYAEENKWFVDDFEIIDNE